MEGLTGDRAPETGHSNGFPMSVVRCALIRMTDGVEET